MKIEYNGQGVGTLLVEMVKQATGVLEYRNADCRLRHIHEHDVTSSLKGKREKTFQKGKREKIFRFVQFRVFFLEEYIKNSEDNVDHIEQSCQQAISQHLGTRKYLSQVFRQCDVYLFWSRNDSENVERRTHIPQTLKSMSVDTESTSVKGKHQRRILTRRRKNTQEHTQSVCV